MSKLSDAIKVSNESENDDDDIFLVDDPNDDMLGDINSYAEDSFHSLHSDNSIVRHIENMGMDLALPLDISSQSGSAKRRMEDIEDDDVSSALKRERS